LQLDNAERGFSFSRAGKLDMRMDTTKGMDAMRWLAEVDEQVLIEVLRNYGEERFSHRIARAILAMRAQTPITTTVQLAEIIKRAVPKQQKKSYDKHPATRSFQAIRIAINQELNELQLGLAQALEVLALGGRLVVISFHSLEDRLVKRFIKQQEKGKEHPRDLPIKHVQFQARLKSIAKVIKPSLKEINFNPRARSAILRAAERVS
jgi:16S rRNA (cytosine1402-N4)-methyltransferase